MDITATADFAGFFLTAVIFAVSGVLSLSASIPKPYQLRVFAAESGNTHDLCSMHAENATSATGNTSLNIKDRSSLYAVKDLSMLSSRRVFQFSGSRINDLQRHGRENHKQNLSRTYRAAEDMITQNFKQMIDEGSFRNKWSADGCI